MMRLIHTKAQSGQALNALIVAINEKLQERGHIATGTLLSGNSAVVNDTGKQVIGLGYAYDYWVNVGNGSPPGTRVAFLDLVRWAKAKGRGRNERETLRIAALVGRKIRREGSLDFREGNPNVYLETIDEFEQAGRFLPAEGAERDLLDFTDQTFKGIN